MSEQARRRLLKRLDTQTNRTACAPELTPVQYTALNAIWTLSPTATFNKVIDYVYETTGDVMDVAQMYVTINGFQALDKPLVDELGKMVTTKGRRPSAYFSITDQGKAAIARTEDHWRRLLAFGTRAQQAPQPTKATALAHGKNQ